jgi:hypothetical protein
MIDGCLMGEYMEGTGRGLLEVLSQYFSGEAKENHRETSIKIVGVPQSFEPRTFLIHFWIGIVTAILGHAVA